MTSNEVLGTLLHHGAEGSDYRNRLKRILCSQNSPLIKRLPIVPLLFLPQLLIPPPLPSNQGLH